jgi:hypothetical protein
MILVRFLDLKFPHEFAAQLIGTSNPPHQLREALIATTDLFTARHGNSPIDDGNPSYLNRTALPSLVATTPALPLDLHATLYFRAKL